MTPEELAEILDRHGKWLRGEEDGSGAYLSRANLSRAYLSGANLNGAYLSGANLNGAYLSDTCLDPDLLSISREFCHACPPVGRHGGRIVYRTAQSRHVGNQEYMAGHTYTAPILSWDVATACHPGIYAASLEWMRREYPDTLLVRCYVRDGEWTITAKGAIRCHKIRVLDYVPQEAR